MAELRVDRRPAAAAVVAAALVVSSLLYPAAIAAPVASSTEAMDEVVVSGEQPGPGLWKVTKGNHTLWILGTLTPLPQKMTWRSREVEKVVAASNEVIGQESVSPNIGFFRGISLLPSLLRARYNPNGATLKDVLPAPLYARWSRLKAQYIGNDSGIERWRPMFAAIRLYSKALENSGLTQKSLVWPVIRKTAKQNGVRITDLTIKLDLDNPKQTIRDFNGTPREADVACLAATMDRLETDLGGMKQRANAWAVGDVEALQHLPFHDQVAACIDALTSNPGLQDEVNNVRVRFRGEWLAAAERSLSRNDATFATLPISELIGTDGRLSKLKADGYEVQQP
jgi:uncharacterized protein YbaP (TraB family)